MDDLTLCNNSYKLLSELCNDSYEEKINKCDEIKKSILKCDCQNILSIFFLNCSENNHEKNCQFLLNKFQDKCVITSKKVYY
jgi:hypothetical protein